jgi:hypothetical protein
MQEQENVNPEGKEPSSLKRIFVKNICGDLFGSQPLPGMIFRSKIGLPPKRIADSDVNSPESIARGSKERLLSQVKRESSGHLEKDNESTDRMSQKLNPRQQLALTMKNWSAISANDAHLIAEGGIEALVALSSIEDVKIKKSCAGK